MPPFPVKSSLPPLPSPAPSLPHPAIDPTKAAILLGMSSYCQFGGCFGGGCQGVFGGHLIVQVSMHRQLIAFLFGGIVGVMDRALDQE